MAADGRAEVHFRGPVGWFAAGQVIMSGPVGYIVEGALLEFHDQFDGIGIITVSLSAAQDRAIVRP